MTETSTAEIEKAIAELRDYAELDGSEWGEAAIAICEMWTHSWQYSKTLVKALEKEILAYLRCVKSCTEIKEYEETENVVRKYRELEWY